MTGYGSLVRGPLVEPPSRLARTVCRECGRTVEIEGPAVESWADTVAAQHGFRDVSHTLEVFGTCAKH